MSDIRCTKCGEPWDIDTLHEMGDWVGETLTFAQARERFYREGCRAFRTVHNVEIDTTRASAEAVLVDLLGDDVDGVAAMLEDFEWIEAERHAFQAGEL